MLEGEVSFLEGCCSLGFLDEDLIIINFWRTNLKSHNMTVVGEDRLYRSISYIKFEISILAETPIL